jgi:hypothetical protein
MGLARKILNTNTKTGCLNTMETACSFFIPNSRTPPGCIGVALLYSSTKPGKAPANPGSATRLT